MSVVYEALRGLMPRKALTNFFPSHGNIIQPGTLFGERDYRRDVGNGDGSSLIQSVVGYYARTFPEAPVQLTLRGDEDQLIDNHAMLELLDRPNDFYSGVILFMATMVSWVTDGNAYWRKIRSGAGRPVQLWYTPHWMIEPKWPSDGSEYISHYEYNPGGTVKPQRLAPEDVVHFRYGLDPHNTRKGMSWVKVLLRELYTDEEAARFASSMLRNMGIVGLVLSPESSDDSPSADDVEALKTLVYQRTTGDERGKPIVSNVPIKVHEFGSPAATMDTSKLRAVPESRVSALSGIPAAVLGFLSGMQQTQVGATLAELRELAYESAIIPTHRIFSGDLKTQLLDDYVDNLTKWEVGWDYTKVRVLQEDQTKLWTRTVDAVNRGVVKLNEGRTALGFATVPNEDVYLRPLSMVEVSAADVGTFRPQEQDEGEDDTSVPGEGEPAGPPADPDVREDR